MGVRKRKRKRKRAREERRERDETSGLRTWEEKRFDRRTGKIKMGQMIFRCLLFAAE